MEGRMNSTTHSSSSSSSRRKGNNQQRGMVHFDLETILEKDTGELSKTEVELLEKKFQEWENKTNLIRSKFKSHREYLRDKQNEKLLEELQNIDARVEEEHEVRVNLEDKVAAMRQKEAELAIEEENLERQTDEYELNCELENIALLRIKLDRFRDDREKLEMSEMKCQAQIEAIQEEHIERSYSGQKTLERLLKKVDHLRSELNHPEYIEINVKEQLGGDALNGNKEAFLKLNDQVMYVREQRRCEKTRELQTELSNLCNERDQYSIEEIKLAEKKEALEKIHSKGLDYLVEIELGNAPSDEFILANFQEECDRSKDGASVNEEEDCGTIESILENVEKSIIPQASQAIKGFEQKLTDLEKERKQIEASWFFPKEYYEPYDGSLGRESYPAHLLHTHDIVREIVYDITDSLFEKHAKIFLEKNVAFKHAEDAIKNWSLSKQMLLDQIGDARKERAIQMISDAMVNSVISSIIRGIYGELDTASKLSSTIASGMILDAIFGLCGGKKTLDKAKVEMIEETYQEIRKQRDLHMPRTSRIPPTDMHFFKLEAPFLPTSTSVFYSSNAAYNKESMANIQAEVERRHNLEIEHEKEVLEKKMHLTPLPGDNETPPNSMPDLKEEDNEENDEDLGAVMLKFGFIPSHSNEILQKRDPGFADLERNYWNKISFRSKHVKIPPRYGTTSAFAGSATGEFLAVGTGLGCLLVFDLRTEDHPVMVRQCTNALEGLRSPVAQIEWSLDTGTRIVTLDYDGVVRMYSTQSTDVDSNKKKKKKKKLFQKDSKFQSEDLRLLLQLTWKSFARPEQKQLYEEMHDIPSAGDKKKKKKEAKKGKGMSEEERLQKQRLTPVKVGFHTARTLFGLQSSLLVALNDGTICKYNTDSDKQAGERCIFAPCHARKEPTNPLEPSMHPGERRPKGSLFGATIRREFMQHHKHPITFMGFANRSSEVLFSLDESHRMRLWPYTPESFSGFGWYLPSTKFTLDFRKVAFNADPSKPVEEMFPPQGYEIPSGKGVSEDVAIQQDKKFLDIAKRESEIVAQLDIEDEPWLTKPSGKNGRTMHIFAPKSLDPENSSAHQVLVYSKSGVLLKRLVSYFQPVIFNGQLIEAQLSTSGAEIWFLVQYPGTEEKPASLKLFSFDINTCELGQSSIELELKGAILPHFIIGPTLGDVGSDYAYILMDNRVHVISLTTGTEVCQKLQPTVKEPNVKLTDVWIARDHSTLACIAVNEPIVYIFAIDNMNPTGQQHGSRYRPRLGFAPRETWV